MTLRSACGHCGAAVGVGVVDPREDYCPACGAPARLRALAAALAWALRGREVGGKALLGFAVTRAELEVVRRWAPQVMSVSLFGSYRQEHTEGVDIRDLGRFAPASFSGVFGSLIFDYFVEHAQAIRECARVTEPGGFFLTHISAVRLIDGELPPVARGVVRKRAGYFEYLPEDARVESVHTGRTSFLNALSAAGYLAGHCAILDELSGAVTDWFLGVLPPFSAGSARPATLPIGEGVAGRRAYREFCASWEAAVGRRRCVLRVSIPALPAGADSARFAEHVYDRGRQKATGSVILAGNASVVTSEDNGEKWELHRFSELEGRRLNLCFTTNDGAHIVQCLPESAENADVARRRGHTNPARATVLRFDAAWRLTAVEDGPEAVWHGRASVDQNGGVLMFAEYPANFAGHRDLPSRVLRSRDDGRSWEVVFEVGPEAVRHFHTLQADPFAPGVWWLSSGDAGEECRVWRSPDDGDTWADMSVAEPQVEVGAGRRRGAYRYTDLVVERDTLLWGADDLLGAPEDVRLGGAGARMFRARKTALHEVEELGYIGHPVRSIVDVGEAYLCLTEAKYECGGFSKEPRVVMLRKDEMCQRVEVAVLTNETGRATGLSYSRASKAACEGRFFSFRGVTDVFNGVRPGVFQWEVELDN